MFCYRYRRLINLELDDRLPDHRVPDLERHLRDCPDCRAYREELALGRRLLAATAAEPSPAFEWTLQLRLNRALQEAARSQAPWPETPDHGWSWWRRLALSSFAGAAITAALALWLLPGRGPMPAGKPGGDLRSPTRHETVAAISPVTSTAGAGDRRSLSAPDLFGPPRAVGLGRLASTPRYLSGGAALPVDSPSLVDRLLRENEVLRSQVLILQSRNRALQALLTEQSRDRVGEEGVGAADSGMPAGEFLGKTLSREGDREP